MKAIVGGFCGMLAIVVAAANGMDFLFWRGHPPESAEVRELRAERDRCEKEVRELRLELDRQRRSGNIIPPPVVVADPDRIPAPAVPFPIPSKP